MAADIIHMVNHQTTGGIPALRGFRKQFLHTLLIKSGKISIGFSIYCTMVSMACKIHKNYNLSLSCGL